MPPLNQLLRRPAQSLMLSVTSHRILAYIFFSLVAVVAAIANALKNHSNFYSVTIYLSKSSRSVLILANFAFLLALLGGHITQRIFFGALRPNEIERLYDRLWFFITESLLAFTIFRDEFDIPFALMFGFLLFVKSFHWLASDRIEWMDQRPYPGPPLLFHVRMSILFTILWITDFVMFLVAVESTLAHGVGGMVLFASEYGILMASITNTLAKYLLSSYELRRAGQRGGENAPPWENKSMWVFYIELTTDFLKLTTYLAFFSVIITFYGLPLNIVRDVYITARSLYTRLQALHRYQVATRNMDQRYPNATEQELSAMSDRTCIICREEMVSPATPAADAPPAPNAASDGPNMTPKKLPCGHIFHFHCLRSWLERQQSCPTCRRNVLENNNRGQPPAAAGVGPQGAPPQNPLLGGGLGAQNFNLGAQPGVNENNNGLGFLGRLLGQQNPQQPGGVRRVFPLPPVAANPGAGPGAGAANVVQDAAGRVVIQYNIQYHVPRPGQEQGAPPPPPPPQVQQLRPVPQFNGFEGPGNIWQPWPADAPAGDEQAPNTDTNADSTASGTSPPASNPASVNPQSEPSPEASTSTATTMNPSPREGAALAALRRFHSANNSAAVTEAASTSRPVPEGANSTLTQRSPSDGQSRGVDVPGLIPLYDFDFGEHQQAPTTTPSASIAQASASRASVPQHVPTLSSPPQPLSTTGPMVTEDQLSVLDRVTREAIDERLRILERVSMNFHQSMEDLMKVRSVLPPLPQDQATLTSPKATSPPADTAGTAPSTSESEGSHSGSGHVEGNTAVAT
ncbi:synoviolin 1 isoform b [Moniliophthora roreri MCA 2997]|uniref:RING-type E3 ubiquitin transferase n=2 Tax=Moniliophthora roreri TaxID=221103 RepID=V2WXJ4_MONRO|nr:synoviolin 1 isoform b [Moniliophthora roreri MCA 2997]